MSIFVSFLQQTARTHLEWSQSDRELPTRGIRYSNWKRNSTSIGTWRDDDESRSLIIWSCRSDRSKSGFRTVVWNGRKTTSCQIRRTCAGRTQTAKHRQQRRSRRSRRRHEQSPGRVAIIAKGKTTIRPPAVWRTAWTQTSVTIWAKFMGSAPLFLLPWFIQASKVTLILWLISKRSWVIITWVEWWTVRREDRWDT